MVTVKIVLDLGFLLCYLWELLPNGKCVSEIIYRYNLIDILQIFIKFYKSPKPPTHLLKKMWRPWPLKNIFTRTNK